MYNRFGIFSNIEYDSGYEAKVTLGTSGMIYSGKFRHVFNEDSISVSVMIETLTGKRVETFFDYDDIVILEVTSPTSIEPLGGLEAVKEPGSTETFDDGSEKVCLSVEDAVGQLSERTGLPMAVVRNKAPKAESAADFSDSYGTNHYGSIFSSQSDEDNFSSNFNFVGKLKFDIKGADDSGKKD